jgi:hypothetical protein
MAHFVGLDVSVKETSVCVVDDASTVVLEQRVPLEQGQRRGSCGCRWRSSQARR